MNQDSDQKRTWHFDVTVDPTAPIQPTDEVKEQIWVEAIELLAVDKALLGKLHDLGDAVRQVLSRPEYEGWTLNGVSSEG